MSTRMVFVVVSVAVTVLLAARAVAAHHSGAGFDATKVMEVTGTVKEFQFKNPHSWIQLLVDSDKGQPVEWSIEWGSPNNLGRQGVRPSTFPAGARVTIRLNPIENGGPAGGFVGARFPDGRTVGRWDESK